MTLGRSLKEEAGRSLQPSVGVRDPVCGRKSPTGFQALSWAARLILREKTQREAEGPSCSVRPGNHLELRGKGVSFWHPGQGGVGAAGHREGGGSLVCVSTRLITWSSSAGWAAPWASP